MERSLGTEWVTRHGHTLPRHWVRVREEDGKIFFEDGGSKVAMEPPQAATPEAVAARLAICGACAVEHTIRDMRPAFATVTVKCKACTKCEGGRSLAALGQSCPLKKW